MMNTKDMGGDKLSGKLFNDLPFGNQAQFNNGHVIIHSLFSLVSLSLFDKNNQLNLMNILLDGNSYSI